jgi:hypothetical protein
MQEFNYYYAELSKGEMVGPLNYYRTARPRYDEELGKEESWFLVYHQLTVARQVSPPIFVQIYPFFSFGALKMILRFPLPLPNQKNIYQDIKISHLKDDAIG